MINHLAKFMVSKRRIWKDEQKMKCGFSMEFSTIRSPNRVLTTLKSASKIRIYLLFILPKSSFGKGKVVTKDRSIPEKVRNPSHCMMLSFESSCKVVTKDSSIPEKPTQRMMLSFVSSCKVVTKDRIHQIIALQSAVGNSPPFGNESTLQDDYKS
jgi:hypothetical protein